MNNDRPKFHCFQAENGDVFKEAYFHGYDFGDRQLEGVWFKAEIASDGMLTVETLPKHTAYLTNKCNHAQVMKDALEYAEDATEFAREPGGQLELELIPFSCHRVNKLAAGLKAIKATPIADVLAKLSANPHIPTGADFHIAAAKHALAEFEVVTRSDNFDRWYAAHDIGQCLEHAIRALELIQAERKQEKE